MEGIVVPSGKAFTSWRVTLDGAEFVITLSWSQREAKWYLGLLDQDENPILRGVKVVADYPLLTLAHWDARCPTGELVAYDTSGQGLDPHFADMGDGTARVQLYYIPQDELP
jgi:hypothetical protein